MDRERPKVRLYVADDLSDGAEFALPQAQGHYLATVMRLKPGDEVAAFNGRDGEWRALVVDGGRRSTALAVVERLRLQAGTPDLWLVFAPIKRARIDFLAARATELGVSALWPVFTRRTAVARVNAARLKANAVEAAEQCGRLDVPEILEPTGLDQALAGWPRQRRILLCDETGAGVPVAEALAGVAPEPGAAPGPWAVLVGPEGGFAPSELDALGKLPFVTAAGLGPRILRADTAATAALTCWQVAIGDWRRAPGHETGPTE